MLSLLAVFSLRPGQLNPQPISRQQLLPKSFQAKLFSDPGDTGANMCERQTAPAVTPENQSPK
jgi:hypothetical protein